MPPLNAPAFQDSIVRQPLPPPQPTGSLLSFYACGITPYSPAHIGHARSFVVFDLMRNTLEQQGYSVRLVRNVTDIDDKIIAQAQRTGQPWQELSSQMHARNQKEMARMGAARHETPHASAFIPAIHHLIEKLLDKGMAYVGGQGDVLFSVRSFPGSQLMPHDLEDLGDHAGRGVSSEGKRDALDFVLWKQAKPGEPAWVSPWGEGRPGWHVECSAMVEALFGDTLDYHGGGTDLRFPHHQAEIQQSEGAWDRPLAHRWVHHGSVRDSAGRKMSKSLGNVVILADALEEGERLAPGAGGAVVRMALLGALWTKPLDWSPQALIQVAQHLKRWAQLAGDERIEDHDNPVRQALANNLNTPAAMAALHAQAAQAVLGDPHAAQLLAGGLTALGVDEEARRALRQSPTVHEVPDHIQQWLKLRQVARQARDWKNADVFRDHIRDAGWEVEDRPEGALLTPKGR